MLRALLKSNSLRAAAVLGLGGLAFTLGNLILARTLPAPEYGLVSLVIGIVAVTGLAAPLGLDLVIGRRGLPLEGRLRRAILGIATAVGLLAAIASALIYRLDLALTASIAVVTIASGLMQASAAHFQGQQRFGAATWLVQCSNWTVLAAAVLTGVLGLDTARASCSVLALTSAAGGVLAWMLAARAAAADEHAHSMAGAAREAGSSSHQPPTPVSGALLQEALSLASIHIANAIFLQLERLLLAPAAGVDALALFGVVAALVASPFRMLQMSVLFTLIPSLRRAAGLEERRRLLAREAVLVAAVIGAGSIVIWYVSPPLAHWFLAGRYELGPALMCAALVSGILKLCSAFATGTVIALADKKGLRQLGFVSWATIGMSGVGAFVAAPWGLVGVLYGIASGWLVRSVIAARMARPHLRRPDALHREARFADRSQMPRARR
jgi:O-antigen/teichoic acid export membrane protein